MRVLLGQELILVIISNNYIVVLVTPQVPVYFWPNRHNFGDIELKFCILP